MLNRHDLLKLTDSGRQYASEHLYLVGRVNSSEAIASARELILKGVQGQPVPAIVRRKEFDERQEAGIGVGFTFPFIVDGMRLRVASMVLPEYVEEVIDPFMVMRMNFFPRVPALQALAILKRNIDFTAFGVWGSAGLEIYTGLPYTHVGSDLDLLFLAKPMHLLKEIFHCIEFAERQFGIRIDAEIRLHNGWGVSLKELLSDSEEILAKSLNAVDLLNREEVLECLS